MRTKGRLKVFELKDPRPDSRASVGRRRGERIYFHFSRSFYRDLFAYWHFYGTCVTCIQSIEYYCYVKNFMIAWTQLNKSNSFLIGFLLFCAAFRQRAGEPLCHSCSCFAVDAQRVWHEWCRSELWVNNFRSSVGFLWHSWLASKQV